MVNVKIILTYVLTGTLITTIFGELLAVYLAGNTIFLQYWLPITLYYVAATFVFSLFVFKMPPLLVPLVFFIYGVVMETFVFGNIKGLTDIPGVLFFGNQYIALFGLPYVITKKLRQI